MADLRTPIESWLIDLGNLGSPYRKVARRYLQIIIHTAVRTGHRLDLDGPDTRRGMACAARSGLLLWASVRCANCGAAAPMVDWEILANSSLEGHRALIMQAQVEGSLPRFGYLLRCLPAAASRQPAPAGVHPYDVGRGEFPQKDEMEVGG